MLPGFKKHFGLEIEDPRIEFFAEHYIADADHSSRQIDLVAKHVTTEEMQKRALEVAETMVRTRWAGITECYRSYVQGEKDPLPKGIAA
jgi:pyrroloquinoline quinone (PQQ) biosynthesis protein C